MRLLAALTLVALLLLAARTASAQDEVAAEPQDAVVDPYRDAVDSENAVPEDAVGAEDPELPTPGDDTSPEPEDAVGEKPAALEDSTPAKTAADESAAPEEPKQGAGTEGVTPDTAASTEPPSSRSAVDWLRAGVEAYLSESWGQCVRSLENALVEWNFFRRAHIDCRLRCGAEARRARPLFPDDVEHLHFVEEMVRATLCLIKCKRTAFRGRATGDNIPDDQKQTFRDLKPYEYLQLCYYQVSEIQKAASAVFTILSHDPSNEIMKNNLKFYLATGDVDDKAIINYEAEKYVSLYLRGTEAYYSEDYGAAVINLEASLKEFLHAAEECRADCEGPFDQGWLPDFTSSIANHYVFCLKCKAKCHSKLSQLNGDKYEDFLPMHYNYLQFAYYKRGNLEKACAAAATYLMFSPADETMMENVEYYKSLPKVHAGMFQPIADAEHYVKRQAYEEALLRYISDEFVFEDSKENNPPPSDEILEQDGGAQFSMVINSTHSASSEKGVLSPYTELAGHNSNNMLEEEEIIQRQYISELETSIGHPIFNMISEEYLGGSNRFMVDGLADESECLHMIHFATMGAVSGDGYEGRKSPHSSREKFEGITLGRAALMVHYGSIDLSTLDLFLRLSERGRNLVAAYFNIVKDDLYFSFTHLVCRSAMKVNSLNGSYYSHEIHADNCWLQRDGSCVRSHPAFYWRHYSALLYLNDDFEGGEFIFSEDPKGKHIQSSIKPTCGRFIGFTAGQENLHGVRGVRSGRRCALALWFTLDQGQAEWGRYLTEKIVPYLRSGEQPTEELLKNLKKLEGFDLKEVSNQKKDASCNQSTKASCNFETKVDDNKMERVSHTSNSSMH